MNELPKEARMKDFQQHIYHVCKERGWDKNSVSEKFLLLSEEVGELARAIRDAGGISTKYETKGRDKSELSEEFADVLNYLFDLANDFDIDLEEAYRAKHEKNKTRTWEN